MIVAGLMLLVISFTVHSAGFVDTLLFKVAPFIVGLACFVSGAYNLGWFAFII